MKKLSAVVAALALLSTPAFAQSSYPSAGQSSNFLGISNLSSCMRNALIGAGVGGVLGGVTAPRGNKTENTVLGAVLGGGGTYLVCKYLGNRDRSRIEGSYLSALNGDAAQTRTFSNSQLGGRSTLTVGQPQAVQGMDNCRDLTASLNSPLLGLTNLPNERYCKGADGKWAPTQSGF
jgi:surface antigen